MTVLWRPDDLLFATLCLAVFWFTDHHTNAAHTWNRAEAGLTDGLSERLARGQARRRAVLTILFLASLPSAQSLLARGGDLWEPLTAAPFPVFFLGWNAWIACSLLWCCDRHLATRRVMAFLLTTLGGISVGAALGPARAILIANLVVSGFLVVGVVNEAGQRTFFKRPGYRFAGTLHPNQQGANCVLVLLTGSYLCHIGAVSHFVATLQLAGAAAVLLMTRSRSAVWTGFAAVAWWLVRDGGRSAPMVLGSLGLGVATYLGCLHFLGRKTTRQQVQDPSGSPLGALQQVILLGRESRGARTLTGRMDLWRHAVQVTVGRRLLGRGFGCFWDGERVRDAERRTGWRFADCHSAYLETVVGTGVIGGILLAATIAAGVAVPLSLCSDDGAFLSAFFLFVGLQGLLESSFVIPSAFLYLFSLFAGSVLHPPPQG